MKEFYLQQIEEATDLDQLDYLMEDAADKVEDSDDYLEIVEAISEKIRSWSI